MKVCFVFFDSLSVSLDMSSVLHLIKESILEGSILLTQQGEDQLRTVGMDCSAECHLQTWNFRANKRQVTPESDIPIDLFIDLLSTNF